MRLSFCSSVNGGWLNISTCGTVQCRIRGYKYLKRRKALTLITLTDIESDWNQVPWYIRAWRTIPVVAHLERTIQSHAAAQSALQNASICTKSSEDAGYCSEMEGAVEISAICEEDNDRSRVSNLETICVRGSRLEWYAVYFWCLWLSNMAKFRHAIGYTL